MSCPLSSPFCSAPVMEFPGLSFSPGFKLQDEVRYKLGAPVSHPVLDHYSFALVAAFGRCKFKLSPSSIGFLLHAAIGGIAAHFNVSQLSERDSNSGFLRKLWASLWSTSAPSIAILSWSPSSFGVMAVPTGGVSLLCSRRRKLIPGWWPLLNLAPDPLLRWSNLRSSLVPTRFPWPLAVLLTVLLRLAEVLCFGSGKTLCL